MDRQIVYVGAVPMDTDLLLQTRSTMTALGYLAKAILGDTGILVDGLGCTPGAGLTVSIGPGSIFVPSNVDAAYYGALPPDGDPLLKAGINTSATTLSVPAGQTSIIAVEFSETLGGQSVIAYYNPANPAQTMLGPNANGQSQSTVMTQRVAFGVSAVGSVQNGYTPLWQVAVPTGATVVTPSMISVMPGAPFIPVKLPGAAPLASPAFSGQPTAPTVQPGDASAALATTGFVAAAVAPSRRIWTVAGTYNWTCPAGVSSVLARLWAAGGHGGSAGNGASGGGGGGGGYLEVLLPVSGGVNYSVQVGGSSSNRTTSFGSMVSVTGGGDGASGSSNGAGAGGSAGSSAGGSYSSLTSVGVAAGSAGFAFANAPVGGAGGTCFGVASGGACFGTSPASGVWPGGGGSGGSSGAGGPGADGLVVLDWYG